MCVSNAIRIVNREFEETVNNFETLKYTTGLSYLEPFYTEQQKKNEEISYLDRKVFETKADVMQFNGFLTLPFFAVKFSFVNLPCSSILLKSNLSSNVFMYWKYFFEGIRKTTKQTRNQRKKDDDEDNEANEDNDILYNVKRKNKILFHPFLKNSSSTESIEKQYVMTLEKYIPSPLQLFNIVKKEIENDFNTSSIIDVISYLEPYLIYCENVDFKLYEVIVEFIKYRFNQYQRFLVQNQSSFAQMNKIKGVKKVVTELSLMETITKQDQSNIEIEYGLVENLEKSKKEVIAPHLLRPRNFLFQGIEQNIRDQIAMDDVAAFSVTESKAADLMTQTILLACNKTGNGVNYVILDGMGGVGGNTISFAKTFKRVLSNELNPTRFKMLRYNVQDVMGLQNVSFFNKSILELALVDLLNQFDIIFLDPEWGGREYKQKLI